MKEFMGDDFLLNSATAADLYHRVAKSLPIIDYHCHLNPKEIWENKHYKNLTEMWLDGDHYKWRAMRANGVEEGLITGNASDHDKFVAWANTMPFTVGNPLFHWSHLELRRYFGITDSLSGETAEEIWEQANARLSEDGFTARSMIETSNVQVIGTTDDPTDSLEYHRKLEEEDTFAVQVIPTFRPDEALKIRGDNFTTWVKKLEQVAQQKIYDYESFQSALKLRTQFFSEVGCRASDHSIQLLGHTPTSKEEVAGIFERALRGESISRQDEEKYQTYTLRWLAQVYSRLGWVMQIHLQATRNNNTHMYETIGENSGFDSINDSQLAKPLCMFLDALEQMDALPKMILYSLNPNDYPVLAALMGSFQTGVPGKIQLGTAWWFNDTKDGMIEQMKTLANIGLFGRFVGMTTDSRSLLSYTRHEYFRRILCNLLGEWVESGELPNDPYLLENIIVRLCSRNALEYFNLT